MQRIKNRGKDVDVTNGYKSPNSPIKSPNSPSRANRRLKSKSPQQKEDNWKMIIYIFIFVRLIRKIFFYL